MSDNKRDDPVGTMLRLIAENPEAKIATDVGRSMFSGLGYLTGAKYLPDQHYRAGV